MELAIAISIASIILVGAIHCAIHEKPVRRR